MSYDDDAPYPEFETEWVRPQGEPCPDCKCCTRRLCAKAKAERTSCALQSDDPGAVAGCPCSAPKPGDRLEAGR